MVLFLLFSTPIAFFLVNPMFSNAGIRKRVILMPLVAGMVLSIPFYLLYWSFLGSFFNDWTSKGVFFYYFINKNGSAVLYINSLLILYYTFVDKNRTSSRLREITAYITGMLFTLGIYDSLLAENWYGVLELFIIPFDRIILIFVSAIFIKRSIESSGWIRYIWMVIALISPFILNLLPYMASFNKSGISLFLSVFGALLSYIFYFFESRN
ncbi:MAG: hypothetical protein EH225_13070 [Calditrichaeota bacterium]|nr:MAG: hypothetical protein EH225_13070 [Calditrichota bacterium]